MAQTWGSTSELNKSRLGRELLFGVLFAVAGALLGGMGGNVTPALVGAVLGGVLGAVAGWSLNSGAVQKARHEAALDQTIGTEGGTIGVPGLEHPPAQVGAYSGATSGIATSVEDDEAAGPITRPPA